MSTNKIDDADIMLWPEGTWCYRDELEGMTHMSDDYQVLLYGSEEWNMFVKDNNLE